MKCFIWSQEDERKGIAKVCPNQAPENQEMLVERAFPGGYYALGMGWKAKKKILEEAE